MARQNWSDARVAYEALRPKSARTVPQFLAARGVAFDEMLRRQFVEPVFEMSDGTSWFVPSAALALLWSRHARAEGALQEYVAFATDVIRGAVPARDLLGRFAWRFGTDSLGRSLLAFQAVARECPDLVTGADFPSPGHARAHQSRLIGALLQHPVLRATPGVGPWLGLAPYKIMLIHRADWWGAVDTDEVLQPLGTIAEKALRLLARSGIVDEDELRMLTVDDDSNESTRQDAFASVTIAQGIQARLARAANSRVMHVNSALYELGAENA